MNKIKPEIELRVYSRDTNDMTLVYNYKLIDNKFALSPIISINKYKLKYTLIKEKSSDAKDGDIKVFIDYKENKLNSKNRYKVDFCFNEYNYSLIVEPKGVIPHLKDDKKYFSQSMIWDNIKQRWIKMQSIIDNYDRNNLIVHDPNNNIILKEILIELKEIKNKIK